MGQLPPLVAPELSGSQKALLGKRGSDLELALQQYGVGKDPLHPCVP